MKKFKIEAECGERIEDYANRMVRMFYRIKDGVPDDYVLDCGIFNGVQLHCHRHTTEVSILGYYYNTLEKNAKQYRESDEYKLREANRKREIQEMNILSVEMEMRFAEMDKRNYAELLEWLKEYQPLTDRVGVNTNSRMIVNSLEEAGYREDMNLGDAFNRDDMVNVAEYIVGQCIGCLNGMGAIHQVVHKFIDEWIEKWK